MNRACKIATRCDTGRSRHASAPAGTKGATRKRPGYCRTVELVATLATHYSGPRSGFWVWHHGEFHLKCAAPAKYQSLGESRSVGQLSIAEPGTDQTILLRAPGSGLLERLRSHRKRAEECRTSSNNARFVSSFSPVESYLGDVFNAVSLGSPAHDTRGQRNAELTHQAQAHWAPYARARSS